MEKLLTVKEVADILRCDPQTVYKNQELPRVNINGVKFKESEVEKYIENCTQKMPSFYSQLIDNERNSLTLSPPECIIKSGGISEMPKGKNKTRFNFGYGAIYQRKNKTGNIRWYLDYRDTDGKRVQKVAPLAMTPEEAKLALQEAVRSSFDKEYRVSREKEKLKFSELAMLYIDDYAKLNKRSWQNDQYRLHANMIPFFGKLELHEVTPQLIEKYRASRLKAGVSKSTINREVTIMKKMFNVAIDWQLYDSNPVLKVKLFSEKGTEKQRLLSVEEEARLLERSPDYLKPILITALNTGMRRGEILNLEWKQIDFEKELITANQVKSGNQVVIPMNSWLLTTLLKQEKTKNNCSYVFPNPRTGKPYVELKKSFKTACRTAAIEDLRFHDLRHTFASRLVESGVDLITVRDLLGHFSVRMTQRYTHSGQEQKARAVAQLLRMKPQASQKDGKLLHIRDMYEDEAREKAVTSSVSVN